jgi:predicted DNA-binding transcriptional regulator YafY
VPIEGAPGLGYVLRRGYDLPPLMFTSEEADAIAIGVRLLRRLRDAKLQQAAERVLAKLAVVVPEPLQPHLVSAPIYVSDGDAPPVIGVDPALLRDAIHEARKVAIAYMDEQGRHTDRTVRPIAMAYYVDVTVLGAWCELRNDFRNFRVDRISNARLLDERFITESARLMAEWLALPKAPAGRDHRRAEGTGQPRSSDVNRAADAISAARAARRATCSSSSPQPSI